jgi:hypothetical protein
MLYIFQIKSILKTRKQTNKKNQPNDTFNRFHGPNNKRGISRPLHVNMCLVRKHQLDSPVSICCKSVYSLVKVQGNLWMDMH